MLPWNSFSHGSAPVRTATFCASPSGSFFRMTRRVPTFFGNFRCGEGSSIRTSGGVGSWWAVFMGAGSCSCGVRRVLVHVGDGQVVRPDRRLLETGVQVDVDGDGPAGEVDALARIADRAAPADGDAVDGDVDAVGLERGVGGADRGEDPAPVGVVTEQRGLEQVVARAGPAGGEG